MADLVLLGGGGHARSVHAALAAAGRDVRGYVAPKPSGDWDLPYLGTDEVLDSLNPEEVQLVNGLGSVGSTVLRRRVHEDAVARGFEIAGAVHPRAIVDSGAAVAVSAQVLAGAVVNVGAVIEEGAIVNSAAVVEHDATVGAHAHISPGAVLAGGVTVGSGAHVGLGARVLQGLAIGSGSIVGAGAVVIRDVPSGTTVVGVPAREIQSGEEERA
ncbi:acetyltransferase [Microbacterium sp. NPDC055903]